MLVICKSCRNKVDKKIAVVYEEKGRQNKYFCCEECYDNFVNELEKKKKDAENKDRCWEIIKEIFCREVTNSILWKEMNSLYSVYGSELVDDYLSSEKSDIAKAMYKDFDSEYAEIRYFAAILKNNLTDYKKKANVIEKKVEVVVEVDPMTVNYKPKKRRKSLADIEI